MPLLTIDGREVRVAEGATVLDAARALGIPIPTLCHRPGKTPLTSCFVCVVRVNGAPRLVPSCATVAAEGMVVESETEEVRAARRTALELLLSDHLGDCIGPCQSTCPAHMDIPRMLQQIAAGDNRGALVTVKERIPLPAVLGRICPELCERNCRRAQVEGAVAICLLKRFVADQDLASPEPFLPEPAPPTGRRVAIVGSGPAGLTAAYYLSLEGYACTLFEERAAIGGMLRYGVPERDLPRDVLDAEIGLILRLGVQTRCGVRVGRDLPLETLRTDFDAVLLACGEIAPETVAALGLEAGKHGVRVEHETLAASIPGVFAAGSAITPSRHAIRAVADGRVAARAVVQYLAGTGGPARDRPYTVHMGRLDDADLRRFLGNTPRQTRLSPAEAKSGGNTERPGFTPDEARREASRCLHCECSGLETCLLRQHGAQYGARAAEYRGERPEYARDESHPDVVYEPGKCIACGVCVAIAEEAREPLGLTFIGRGFRVRVAVPFNKNLRDGLRAVAIQCARACPTAALALRAGPNEPRRHVGARATKGGGESDERAVRGF